MYNDLRSCPSASKQNGYPSKKPHANCKHHYYRQVRETLSFCLDEYVFIDELPLSSVSEWTTKTVARKPHNKIQSKTLGPFCIVNRQGNSVTMDKQGIPNKESTEKVTHARLRPDIPRSATILAQPDLDISKDSTPCEARGDQSDKSE